jgi:hypothetical protein
VSAEAEESPLLEDVTRNCLVTENTNVCVTVTCKVWISAMAL